MKKTIISLCVLLCAGMVFCFVPFNANKFIPQMQQQIESQYGISLGVKELTVKFGPSIVVKSPLVSLAYDKTEQFASLSGVKLKIAILPLIKKEIKIKDVRIDNADLALDVDKKGSIVLFKKLKPVNNLNVISRIRLKHYTQTLKDMNGQKYVFNGAELVVSDFRPDEHVKLVTHGKLLINNIKHIDYDFSVTCDGIKCSPDNCANILDFLAEIKEKQASASVVADLKVKNDGGQIKSDGVLSIDKLTFLINGERLPYSNANFTLLGNKISVSSVLYTNAVDKIRINGFVTNTDNPSFNIAVKSNKINLQDLLYFARLFSDVSNLDRIKDINGSLYSDFVLKGSLKHLKSNGVFKIENANIVTDKLKINNLNSDIDFADNQILIKTTKAYFNNAPVVITGDVTSNKFNINLIVDKFALKNVHYDKCRITNGIISVIANISGTYKELVPRVEAELFNISGVYDSAKFRLNKLLFKSADKHSGLVTVSNLIINNSGMNTVTIPEMKARITDSDISADKFNIYSADTKVEMSGNVLNYNDAEKLTFALSGRGFINPKGLLNIAELDSVYPAFIEINGNKSEQAVKAQVLSLNPKSLVSIAQPVIYNLAAKYSDNELKISDCSINTYKGVFLSNMKKNIASSSKLCVLTGVVSDLKSPVLKNIKVNFLKTCPVNISHYTAKVNGNIVINGNVNAPEIIGNIKLPILSDKYGCFTAKNITLGLTKNIINFDCANVKIFESALSFVGTAEASLSRTLKIKTINLKSKDIDLDNLSLMLMMAKDTGFNVEIDNGTMFAENVQVNTPVDSLTVTDMNSAFNLKDNIFTITNMSANLFNGKLAGKVNLNVLSGYYSAFIQGRGVSSGPVLKAMTNLKENVCGKLDFDMEVNSSIKSKFLKRANLKFIIRDGQMSTLGKVEHLLYAQNIVADGMLKTSLAVITRAIASKDTGLFKYLNGVLVINNDVVTIKSMKMLGPNMSLYITGHYGLMSNTANAVILGRLSNTLVSSLGSFGTFTMDKFRIALSGNDPSEEAKILQAGVENIPALPQRNTKEFRAIISGPAEAKTSVRSFMWISESEKEYRTREVQQSNIGLPRFIENLPY